MSKKDKQKFKAWLNKRPEIIRELGSKLPPWKRYRVKETGQHCDIASYFEDGTVSVNVFGHDSRSLNLAYYIQPICVLGLGADDLEDTGENVPFEFEEAADND